MLVGNGNGFAIALGTSMGFCCDSCSEGAEADTSAATEKEKKKKKIQRKTDRHSFVVETKWPNFYLAVKSHL